MMYGLEYGSGHDVWGFVFMSIIMVLVVIGVIVLIRNASKDAVGSHHKETALDLLKKRYAKGDIDKKEFEEKRKDLSE